MTAASVVVLLWSLSRDESAWRGMLYLGVVLAAFCAISVLLVRSPDRLPTLAAAPSARPAAEVAAFRGLAAVTALLILARVAYAFAFQDAIRIAGDAWNYRTMALNLAETGRLFIDFAPVGSTLHSYFPPLYPLLLGVLTAALGGWFEATILLNALVQAATCVLFVWAGRLLGGRLLGMFAAFLYAASPNNFLLLTHPQKESLLVGLFLLFLCGMLRALDGAPRRAARWWSFGLAGAAYGLVLLTQPSLVLFAPLAACAALFAYGFRRRVAGGLLLVALGGVLVLTPWVVRNHGIHQRFVPLTTASGVVLWTANQDGASGYWIGPPERFHGLTEIEWSERARREAVAWIHANPEAFLRLALDAKLPKLWLRQVAGVEYGTYGFRDRAAALVSGLSILSTAWFHLGLFGALALVASIAAARAPPRPALLFLALLLPALVLYLSAMHAVFETHERHHYVLWAVMPLLLAEALRRLPPLGRQAAGPGSSALPGDRLARSALR